MKKVINYDFGVNTKIVKSEKIKEQTSSYFFAKL